MKYQGNKVSDIKIAYIGGGSCGWAWGLMSDLVSCDDISGEVALYDINYEAAKDNEIIGNMYNDVEGAKSVWKYRAVESAKDAMTGADYVVISILPGTLDEMQSDVHTPEKYGIYQSVGDSTGPGGIVRAMRTVPMYEEIAENIKQYCPEAWVISYTNPMTLCVKTLYRVFPKIRAFGCCHEVFGTQKVLATALSDILGIEDVAREEVKVNPVGVNHFTWLTSAKYKNIDLFPVYEKFAEKYAATGYSDNLDRNWVNNAILCNQKVKLDLFQRYGYIAAAGDRHLAEFCEGKWYLKDDNENTVKNWGFGLTDVPFRKWAYKEPVERGKAYLNGSQKVEIRETGEEGVHQMRAILGLCELVTNVNIPNQGQIPNLPIGAIVETNAVFRDGSVEPIMAGEIPQSIYAMIARICAEQEMVSEGIAKRDLDMIFNAFVNDPLVTCTREEAKELFDEMVRNTEKYLTSYDLQGVRGK